MARRNFKRRNWPDRLYERNGYYSWRDPRTGVEHGLGRDRAAAFAQAVEANIQLAGVSPTRRLVERLAGERTVGEWFAEYAKILDARTLADNTRKSNRHYLKRACAALGADRPVRSITAMQFADACEAIKAEGKARTAQAFRSFCRDAFREAVMRGWLDVNPVRDVKAVKVEVKRSRLTLEVFQAVYSGCEVPWLRNAMALAVVTGQRREDVAEATFRDFRDGAWFVRQQKTGAQLAIPVDLRLDAVGLSLADVLRQCRTTGVVSRYLIHQTGRYGNSPAGSQIWLDTITKRFSDEVEKLGTNWGDRTPPTFHEIRSLSERLYSAQGNVDTQELLGHSDRRMTAVYHDNRGAEWTRIKIS